MLFRTPTDRPESNQAYYENEYVQGFTTSLPSDTALAEMKRSNFANTDKSYSYYISVLSQLGLKPGNGLFDYGCSWGYGSYQFAQAGFDVAAFEVAPPAGASRTRNWACGPLTIWSVSSPILPARSTASFGARAGALPAPLKLGGT